MFCDVVLPLPVDRPFTYRIPVGRTVEPGARVRVPFRNRELPGYVVGVHDRTPAFDVKDVGFAGERILDEKMLALTRWIADRYLCSWGEAIVAAVPAAIRHTAKGGTMQIASLAEAPAFTPRTERQRIVLDLLRAARAPMPVQELLDRAEAQYDTLKRLAKAGAVKLARVAATDVDTLADLCAEPEKSIELTPEQRSAIELVGRAVAGERPTTVLLHGVTGSGKTEVYLQAIRRAVDDGRQAIVLVPEIALTPQTVARFRSRFPRVAVLHSVLTESDRAAQWRATRAGDVDVIVGARSAIFAPTKRLGLVVVDEEHEHTYKQENDPRYHARDVAVKRAELEGAAVVLGSATPSLESLYRARTGEYRLATLPYRIEGRKMPLVRIVDMAAERRDTKRYPVISRSLEMEFKAAIARGEQVILFLNRRGYITYIACRRCEWIYRCRRCDVGMTYHKDRDRCECHQCGSLAPLPVECPECRLGGLSKLGLGTERIEEELKTKFPDFGVRRMDSDAMRTRRDYREALEGLWGGDTDVIVGTQMIAKGLDVPNVTVVGVVSADTAFHIPDFRAAERTFQLLTQVAGRAGRGPKGGTVVVQTYHPSHYAIRAAAAYDFDGFVAREVAERKDLGYPPFTSLVRILVSGAKEPRVKETAAKLAAKLKPLLPELLVQMLGPAPAPIYRIKGRFRMAMMLKASDMSTARDALRRVVPGFAAPRGVSIAVDVDPVSMT